MNRISNFLAKAFHLTKGSSLAASFVLVSPMLLSKIGRFLFFLVAAGFLSVVLTACAGGGGSGGNGGDGSPRPLEVKLTFAPIEGGFRIGNQSAFGDFVSLNITATGGGNDVERNININKFSSDSSYDFTGLAELDWKFQIIGILSDGGEREVDIDFVWPENKDDHGNDGIRSGLDTDGDRRADSVDEDDDNDLLPDLMDTGMVGGRECRLHEDCDDDGVLDDEDNCRLVANQQQTNTDNVTDGGNACDSDDDNDGTEDRDEIAGCVLEVDCDNDGTMDGVDVDDDGDGLIEIASAAQLDEVRYALDGSGRRSTEGGALDSTGCGDGTAITLCSGYELVANISLATYADDEGGKGWNPLGHDTDSGTSECQGAVFDGTFEGNDFMVSDLNINRPGEDCVGLFGHIAVNSEIRNLRLSAEKVRGGSNVGGLVGDGESATIISSSVVVDEVSGDGTIGGLVGDGESATIISSSVIAGQVNGTNVVGGLAGFGSEAPIYSSSVIAGRVSGISFIGGLIGLGQNANIISSSVVGEVEETGGVSIGGLVGSFGSSGKVAYSYIVLGSNTAMLVGSGGEAGVASYWDRNTSGRDSGNFGEAKTSNDLREPTGYTGIYEDWDDDTDIFGDGMSDDPFAVWCDEDNSGSIEMDERVDENRIWDFGTSSQYPAIRCTPLSPAEWRSWWSLDGGKPTLNQTRLDALSN